MRKMTNLLLLSGLAIPALSSSVVSAAGVTQTATSTGHIKITENNMATGPKEPMDPKFPILNTGEGEFVTGNKGPLSLDVVPNFDFGTHLVEPGVYHATVNIPQDEDGNELDVYVSHGDKAGVPDGNAGGDVVDAMLPHFIQVTDNRDASKNNFKLTVQDTGFKDTATNTSLNSATVKFTNPIVTNSTGTTLTSVRDVVDTTLTGEDADDVSYRLLDPTSGVKITNDVTLNGKDVAVLLDTAAGKAKGTTIFNLSPIHVNSDAPDVDKNDGNPTFMEDEVDENGKHMAIDPDDPDSGEYELQNEVERNVSLHLNEYQPVGKFVDTMTWTLTTAD